MAYILLVEDESDLAQLVHFNLRQVGFEVRVAGSGEQALEQIASRLPALVILDLMLPGRSGIEVCAQLRRLPAPAGLVPVLMLTAKGEESDRLAGFEAGADDFVTKPFSVRELVMRVRAILRRGGSSGEGEIAEQLLGVLRLDAKSHRCFVEEQEVALTQLEFRLLQHLLARRGRVQTREQLLQEVWDIQSPIETRTVDTHVMRLREKLGSARGYLETVRGVGYRMVEGGSPPA